MLNSREVAHTTGVRSQSQHPGTPHWHLQTTHHTRMAAPAPKCTVVTLAPLVPLILLFAVQELLFYPAYLTSLQKSTFYNLLW